MKFIVITSPEFIPGEVSYIRRLFDCGLDILHLRKPGASKADMARILDALPDDIRRRIVVHDHFSLCRDYGLLGVHLNGRNPAIPSELCPYSVSASCHSIAEAAAKKAECDYIFLSPIFDSISKQSYTAAYSAAELQQASTDGVIDNRVMALGGVSLDNIPALKQWHFGGAVFLGDVWSRAGDAAAFTHHVTEIRKCLGFFRS